MSPNFHTIHQLWKHDWHICCTSTQHERSFGIWIPNTYMICLYLYRYKIPKNFRLSSLFLDFVRWLVVNSRGGYHVIPGRVTFSLIGCQGVCLLRPRGKAALGKCQGLVRRETGLEISAPPFITVTVSLPVTRFSGPYHPFWVISGRVAAPGSQVIRGLISTSDPLQGSNKSWQNTFLPTVNQSPANEQHDEILSHAIWASSEC